MYVGDLFTTRFGLQVIPIAYMRIIKKNYWFMSDACVCKWNLVFTINWFILKGNFGVQISHVYNKHPLVALDGIFLSLYYHHDGMNQIKINKSAV